MQVADITTGPGRIVATAVHDGHAVRPDLAGLSGIDEAGRLREEDPFTGELTRTVPSRVVGLRSRFEFDLNRPRERAIYLRPEDAWGLPVWQSPPSDDAVQRSLEGYDTFYRQMTELFDGFRSRHTRFVVLDLHSYNHRREGPDAEPDDPAGCPDVNIGTGYIDREFWAPLIERFVHDLSRCSVRGTKLDVRENVKFKGGWFPQWIEANYHRAACPIAVEFKKIFMDEWTGRLDPEAHGELAAALSGTIEGLEEELSRMRERGR